MIKKIPTLVFGASAIVAMASAHAQCPERFGYNEPQSRVNLQIMDGRSGKEVMLLSPYSGSPDSSWGSISQVLEGYEKEFAACERAGWPSSAIQGANGNINCTITRAKTPVLEALRCHARGPTADSSTAELDVITPPVPGCPRYLRKSMVTWRQVGNPQLNTWEIRNRSDKTLKVTFREGGSNSSPDTLPPGQSTQVSLSANQVPPYVVRDFDELFAFNRANGANGKTLRCDLAIRPR